METASAHIFLHHLRQKGHEIFFYPPAEINVLSPPHTPLEDHERFMLNWGVQAMLRACVSELAAAGNHRFCVECLADISTDVPGSDVCLPCAAGVASLARLHHCASGMVGDHAWSPN